MTSNDFPVIPFEVVHTKLGPFKDEQPAHSNFIGAWNAIAYRFQGMVDYDESFTSSIQKLGPGPGQPDRYRQERDLYGFFVSGASLFDAFAFGLYAAGLLVAPSALPNANERQIEWPFTSRNFRKVFPTDSVSHVLTRTETHPAYLDLRKIRNVLAHRIAPPRHHRMSSGANLGRLDIPLNETTTSERRTQFSSLLHDLLDAAQEFVESRC